MRLVVLTGLVGLVGVLGAARLMTRPAPPSGERVRVLVSSQFGNQGFSDQYYFPDLTLAARGSSVTVRRAGGEYALALLPNRPVKFAVQDGAIIAQAPGGSVTLGQAARLEALDAKRADAVRYAILSTKRGDKNPEYPGDLELTVREGRIAVVNELSMESYLERVVPSEMPVTFHPEALKAQAVAARTYALSRILAPPEQNRWKALGADVDDSVAEQVYNNIPTDPATDEAVRATRGAVLEYAGEPIQTNYASTTAGWSANIEEVWPDRQAVPYLVSKPQTQPAIPQPTDEAAWLAFFKSRDGGGFFDAASSLWRWKVSMTREELEAIISKSLPERLKAFPQFTRTLEGTPPDAPGFSVGTLRALRVTKRAAGGYVVGLEIEGSNGRWALTRESQIRTLLRPTKAYSGRPDDIVLERGNGRTTPNFGSLPAASFSMEEERDAQNNLSRVTFWGGGFGHGVGMSQFGADGLGKSGASFDAILAHFYPGAELKTVYGSPQ